MMTKKLLTQIRNEWRSNLWLAAELLVVSVVMWYVVALLARTVGTYLQPRGFDTEHCYLLQLGELTNKSADYRPYGNYVEERANDMLELMERLRRRPEVEAVSLSQNSYPYNRSNSSAEVGYDTLTHRFCIRRLVTPDFVRVFRYRGTRGETPEQLADMLERGEFLASDNLFEQNHNIRLTSLVGKEFHLFEDTTRTYRLGAAFEPVRFSDFTRAEYSLSMAYDMTKVSIAYLAPDHELCVRVKADHDTDFITRLKADSESQLRVGNIYLSEVMSFKDIRRMYQQGEMNTLRNYVAGISFLLLNIFLGLLGTFWFRTQQRRGEIALHMMHGATRRMVLGRLMAEGALLLTAVTLPALVIDFALASAEISVSPLWGWDMLAACALATYLIILLTMLVGIGIPARQAMKVQPAEALHDE